MAGLNLSPGEINLYYPISGVSVYERALVIHRSSIFPYRDHAHKRGVVEKLSRRSVNNFCLVVGASSLKLVSMLTLTYGVDFPLTGAVVKAHLKALIAAIRRRWRGFEWAWFLEFQHRGAPHVHILLTIPCPGREARYDVAKAWARISTANNFWYSSLKREKGKLIYVGERYTRQAVESQHRRKNTWENVRKYDGAYRYVVKYATKSRQKIPPSWFGRVGRFVGWSVGFKLPDVAPMGCSEVQARSLALLAGRDLSGYAVLPRVIFHGEQLVKIL